jgi:hypothetical protein
MARLVSTIDPFLSKLFAAFPLVEWGVSSPFSRRNSHVPEQSTLMTDELIVLTCLLLFRDTVLFFFVNEV